MKPRQPLFDLATHEVTNMPPHMGDQDLWRDDAALRHWVGHFGGSSTFDGLAAAGRDAGRDAVFEKANQANRHGPEIRAFDRYGMRLNAVEFHPAWHDLMDMIITHGAHNFAWTHKGGGAHVGHASLAYLFSQPEGGAMCPMAMTYAVVPSLRHDPALEAEWMPRILSRTYDARDIPANEKDGALIGMFMTEKQGGSDVRANSTRAVPDGDGYRLTGHKFFCSAPMCDAFLVLARTEGHEVSCFLVPRWTPDGTRNTLNIQRLKDKLGNRSNASTEMEFDNTWGVMLGEEGRGVRTIIDMVAGNRVYCAVASAGLMRQGLVQALHHTVHRRAFQKRLIDQPLMRNVLADLAIETEAALVLALRVAAALDRAKNDPREDAFARIGTAVAKYWNCKRAPYHVAEALECHGGPGYVEECIMPRLYREAPINSIWEGSGNVMALDVLRAIVREPGALEAVFGELHAARGNDQRLDDAIALLETELADKVELEGRMRMVSELMALCLQGALLTSNGDASVADAFCASRLGGRFRGAFGTLPKGTDVAALLARCAPEHLGLD